MPPLAGGQSSADSIKQPLEQRDVARRVLSADFDGHRVVAARSPTSTRTTPTGSTSRAATSATDIGVWHSSTILRSSGVALRAELLGA